MSLNPNCPPKKQKTTASYWSSSGPACAAANVKPDAALAIWANARGRSDFCYSPRSPIDSPQSRPVPIPIYELDFYS